MPRSSAFPWTANGATLLLQKAGTCIFPCWPTLQPKGAVSRLYGAYDETDEESERALFVIDEKGIIQWSFLSPDDINPGADGILEALENLSTINY